MTGRSRRSHRTAGGTRMFVTAIPGLAPIVRRTMDAVPGLTSHDSGFDGRSDVVLIEVARGGRSSVFALRLAEDVFVEICRAHRFDGDRPAGWRSASGDRSGFNRHFRCGRPRSAPFPAR